jgi:hypothetical protein
MLLKLRRTSAVWLTGVALCAPALAAPVNVGVSVNAGGSATGVGTGGESVSTTALSGSLGYALLLPPLATAQFGTGGTASWQTDLSTDSFAFYADNTSSAGVVYYPPAEYGSSAETFLSYTLNFELLSAHTFTLRGTLRSTVVAGGDAYVSFQMAGLAPHSAFAVVNESEQVLSDFTEIFESGTLGPGIYSLDLVSRTSAATYSFFGEGMGSFNMAMDFTEVAAPVPEPETYAMLLAGLALLGVASRKRLTTAA